MGQVALYTKYRSTNFDEVVGQKYVVQSVKNAIQENKVGHAYLFCGPRGCGKTTMARLLAKAVNCESPEEAPCGHCASCLAVQEGTHPDIIEKNAANETHVEDIRDLIDKASYSPMMSKYKIYIIDEVHQLSSSAASALLKTLEEPPAHVIFILATTDPHKLLPTIISRCQRFDFSKVEKGLIQNHLMMISEKEKFQLDKNGAYKIAELADGCMRDALSILEQLSAYGNGTISEEVVDQVYGVSSTKQKIDLINAVLDKDITTVLNLIDTYHEKGIDLKRLTLDMVSVLKDCSIYSFLQRKENLTVIDEDTAISILEKVNNQCVLKLIDLLLEIVKQYNFAQSVKDYFVIGCLKMMEEINPTANLQPRQQETKQVEIPEKVVKETKVEVSKESIEQPKIEQKTESIEKIIEEPNITFEAIQMDIDKTVQLLVQCTKEEKEIDQMKFDALKNSFVMDHLIATIKKTNLLVSGKDCIVLGCSSESAMNTINDVSFNQDLYKRFAENGIDKMPYAITLEMYKEAVNQYVEARNQNQLPEPLVIHRYPLKKEEIQSVEERLKGLFDEVEMIEE